MTRITLDDVAPSTPPRPSTPPARASVGARAMSAAPGEFGPVAVLAASLGLYAVASGVESDRAPLVVVGATSWAVLVVGIVWPILALRGTRVSVRAPHDAYVGDLVPVTVTVQAHGLFQIRTLDPPSPWHLATRGARGEIRHLASHRAVMRGVRVEVRAGAPLGVFVRRRTFGVALDAPLHVAPRPVRPAGVPPLHAVHSNVDAHDVAARVGGDTVRSVRPYVAGDPARLVHWATSARRGALVVREHEPPPAMGLAIVVDLRSGGAAAEQAAARASGLARAVLATGASCLLLTAEAAGPVAALVRTSRDVDRRLAAATDGAPPAAPPGWPVEVVA